MSFACYEHDIEVKFNEHLLSSSEDWQWFIDYTEAMFDPVVQFDSFPDFLICFSEVRAVYGHLAQIMDLIGDIEVSIEKDWLIRLHKCILVRCGFIKAEEAIQGNGFYDLLAILSYATYLMNCVSSTRYLFDPRLLYISNLFDLYDFEPLGETKEEFVRLVESVSIDGIHEAVDTLRANFQSKRRNVDDEFVANLLDEHFDENFLSFKTVARKAFLTWEESLLCDAFRTSLLDGRIEPAIQYRNGLKDPDTSLWSEDMLANAKQSFSDSRAICIFETIEYRKYGKKPSIETQQILIKLCLNKAKSIPDIDSGIRQLDCIALKLVLQLIDSKMLDNELKAEFFREMSGILSAVEDCRAIRFMKERRLPRTSEQKAKLTEYERNLAHSSIASAKTAHDLIQVFENPEIARHCDEADAQRALQLFDRHIDEPNVVTAELFYWAMQFFIKAQNNPLLDNGRIRRIMIDLRHRWQTIYYGRVLSGMNAFSRSLAVDNDDIKELNASFLAAPQVFACSCFPLSDESILRALEPMAELAFTRLMNKTTISEYYPERVHVSWDGDNLPIDRMIVDELIRVYNENEYRFLNAMSHQQIADGYFEDAAHRIQYASAMIDIEPAYQWIAKNLPEPYALLPYPDDQPMLGHLTQLFPMLENIIRMIGEAFSIVPFQADAEKYTRLREVSGTLADLISEVKRTTKTIQGSNDFLFVYFVMYSPNGFNIRNECVHGRQYQGASRIKQAFRLTVICTYMMLKGLTELQLVASDDKNESGRLVQKLLVRPKPPATTLCRDIQNARLRPAFSSRTSKPRASTPLG